MNTPSSLLPPNDQLPLYADSCFKFCRKNTLPKIDESWSRIHPTLYGPRLSGLLSVKHLKSGSIEKARVTNQRAIRGLFKLLDGVIAYPEEITNPQLNIVPNQANL